jgi:hypothetical protein
LYSWKRAAQHVIRSLPVKEMKFSVMEIGEYYPKPDVAVEVPL